jgi:alkanesulfonate monooxygenase SsuD/methylene tetrahydromethanopterin reductase-like flavin-dependent oxidoreductase (luciferase family)
MTVFMTMEQRKLAYNMYRRVAEEKYGYEAKPEQLAFCTPCIVAETDEEAMKEGEKYVMWLFNKAMKLRPEFNFPPGYMSERSFLGLLKSGVWKRTSKPTFKELVDTGVVIAGSVDTVIEKLAYYTEELHAGMMVSGGHVGEIPDELVLKHQELMAKEVMPHFRKKPISSEPKPVEINTKG